MKRLKNKQTNKKTKVRKRRKEDCGKGKSAGVTLLDVDIDVGQFTRERIGGVE